MTLLNDLPYGTFTDKINALVETEINVLIR